MKKRASSVLAILCFCLIAQSPLFAQSNGDYAVTIDLTGNGFAHTSVIYFDDESWDPLNPPTYGWDPCCDALALGVAFPQPMIFTGVVAPPEPVSGNRLSINGLPHVFEETEVPLGIRPEVLAQYTFAFKELYTLPIGMTVELEDLALNVTQNLLLDSVYVTWSAPSDDELRFIVRFNPSTITGTERFTDKYEKPQINSVGQQIIQFSNLDEEQIYELFLFDALGKEVLKKEIRRMNTYQLSVNNLESGLYIANLLDEKGVRTTQKILH